MRLKILLAMLGLVALLVAGCGGGDDSSGDSNGESDEPITLGAVLSFTGTQAAFDMPAYNGQQLAIDDINAAGGIDGRPLEMLEFDQQAKPELGQTGALELIDKGAVALICAADFDIGAPCAVTAQEREVPAMSTGAADAKFGAQGIGPFAYTIAETTNAQGAALAEFAFERQGWKTAYVLEGTSFEYTKGVARYFTEAFENLGGKIVGHDTMGNNDTSIASQVTRLKANDEEPDVIMVASTLPGTTVALQQLRTAGVDTPIMGPDGYDGTYWLESLPDLSDVWFVAYGYLEGPEGGEGYELAQKYEEKFGEAPVNSFFLAGYATIQVLAEAIKQAGSTDPVAINDALQQLTDFPTAVGPVTFTEEHHSRQNPEMSIGKFNNGELEFVERITPAEVPDPFK